MTATAVIAAGGTGARFGTSVPKQFLPLAGLPMIVHTLRAFERAGEVDRVVVAVPRQHRGLLSDAELKRHSLLKVLRVVPGGPTRQASVDLALEAIEWPAEYVAIHDAARCLVTPELIDRTIRSCEGWDGAIAALPIRDTLKRVSGETIEKTESRENLWGMQTPQVFRFPFIREAYRSAARKNVSATDDAAVAEAFGGRIRVVEGSVRNLKVTFTEDLALAEKLLKGG